jgi:preprotein translocase subunit YajC
LNSTVVIILIAIALLVLAIIAFLIIRRQRYVRARCGDAAGL